MSKRLEIRFSDTGCRFVDGDSDERLYVLTIDDVAQEGVYYWSDATRAVFAQASVTHFPEYCFAIVDERRITEYMAKYVKPRQVPRCLESHVDGVRKCEGYIEYRIALSPTSISYPRCDKHWGERLMAQDEINRKYPHLAPRDFDPALAGERWDED